MADTVYLVGAFVAFILAGMLAHFVMAAIFGLREILTKISEIHKHLGLGRDSKGE